VEDKEKSKDTNASKATTAKPDEKELKGKQ